MRVLILGAGVAGITTAYFLSKRGYDVTVIDREPEPARQCSYANGGQLSYSHGEPWANPASVMKAIKWMGKTDAPLMFSWRLDAAMWSWAGRFLWQCLNKNTAKNTETMLRLGLYSREIMHRLQDDLNLHCHYTKTGILHLLDTQKQYDDARKQADFQTQFGVPYEEKTAEEALRIEPALKTRAKRLYGCLNFPLDESADIFLFTQALAEREKEAGNKVRFYYDADIKKLVKKNNLLYAVETSAGTFSADIFVMALGAYSPLYLRQIGIHVPIYPMKGYSMSVPLPEKLAEDAAPHISLTDHNDKVVFSRLGNVLRIAGTAEFAGYNHDLSLNRLNILRRLVRENFPDLAPYLEKSGEWACLRPSTPGGPPILGKTPLKNLFLNTGHGTLGWTQAAGSARIVSDIIDGNEPEISMKGLTL